MRRALATLLALPLAIGCEGRTMLETSSPTSSATGAGGAAGAPAIEHSRKLDVLFVVDNSPNTDAFHELLAGSLPAFVERLVHPACVDAAGNVVTTTPQPTDPCPTGTREHAPVDDLHLAVISSSLGGHGADVCSPVSPTFVSAQDDRAHLLTRGDDGGVVPTYLDGGFLDWDPRAAQSPPGEADLGALTQRAAALVRGAGSTGCGFEAPLESLYRFLVDPQPYQAIPVVAGKAAPQGTDALLLQQRADFLRPDSALLIVLITDENDCSTREGGQFYLANQGVDPTLSGQMFHLPRPRSECAKDPDDPCCASCGQATPAGCPPTADDPSCMKGTLTDADDPINLRCFDQKRRFGIDFLYPIERYTRGLTDATVPTRDGSLAPNPLYVGNRSPALVMLTGIVGVPWQDLARDPKNLAAGLRSAAEIDWAGIAADPLMIESIDPRSGVNPPTHAPLAAPQAGPMANPINGHERDIPTRDDLQYACIYPRATPSACAKVGCPCNPPGDDPICQAPSGAYGNSALHGRALPGTRALSLLKSLGDRASVGSVCAASAQDANAASYGYRQALEGTLRMLRDKIR